MRFFYKEKVVEVYGLDVCEEYRVGRERSSDRIMRSIIEGGER